MKTFTRTQIFVRMITCFAIAIIACFYMGCASTPCSRADNHVLVSVQDGDELTAAQSSVSEPLEVKTAKPTEASAVSKHSSPAWRNAFASVIEFLFICIQGL